MSFSLPREGLTFEFLYSQVQGTLLNPLVTGPILISLVYFPRELHSILPTQLQQYLPQLTSKACLTTLKVLLGLGVVRKANNCLSQLMLNNFTRDSWNHGKEVVIVTGAGGGIGEAVVRAVAKSSDAVIALDIKPPEKSLRKLFFPP
jgi:all-trans-retinol dehydrogenase (NAD+)